MEPFDAVVRITLAAFAWVVCRVVYTKFFKKDTNNANKPQNASENKHDTSSTLNAQGGREPKKDPVDENTPQENPLEKTRSLTTMSNQLDKATPLLSLSLPWPC